MWCVKCQWLRESDSGVNSTNHINSDLFNSYVILNQIQLRFFCTATSVWTVKSKFMWLSRHFATQWQDYYWCLGRDQFSQYQLERLKFARPQNICWIELYLQVRFVPFYSSHITSKIPCYFHIQYVHYLWLDKCLHSFVSYCITNVQKFTHMNKN